MFINKSIIGVMCISLAAIAFGAISVPGTVKRMSLGDDISRQNLLGSFDAYRYQGFAKTLEMSPGVFEEYGGYSGIAITQPDPRGGCSILWVRPDPHLSMAFDAGPVRIEYTCKWSEDEQIFWLAVLTVSDGRADLSVEEIHLVQSENEVYEGKEVHYHVNRFLEESIEADSFQNLAIAASSTRPERVAVKFDLDGIPQQVFEIPESESTQDFEKNFERTMRSGPEIEDLKLKIGALSAD